MVSQVPQSVRSTPRVQTRRGGGKKAGGGTAEADNAVFRRAYFPSTIYTHNRENGDGKRGEDAGEDFFVIWLFFFLIQVFLE